MIHSIKLRDVASYGPEGVHINGLKKVNIIYGANGTGKTVISNLLANPAEPDFASCDIAWQREEPLDRLVYNKQFRDANFGKGSIDGVFTLGSATKDERALIASKQSALSELKNAGVQKKLELDRQLERQREAGAAFKEEAWVEVYKKHELPFKDAFVGAMQKELFKKRLLAEYKNNKVALMSLEDLAKRATTIYGESPVAMPSISSIAFDELVSIEENGLWARKVIGKSDVDIAAMIQKLNMNDWVNQGRTYLQEDELCPFCQQMTITKGFRKQLESYFGDTFDTALKDIKLLGDRYRVASLNLTNLLSKIEATEKEHKGTKLDVDTFSAYSRTLSSQLAANNEMLKSKAKEPSRSLELTSTKEQLNDIQQLLTDAQTEITKHNSIVANYNSERAALTQSVWRFLADEYRSQIEAYGRKASGLQEGVDNLTKQLQEKRVEYAALDDEIKERTKNLTSIQPSIDEMNKRLDAFGFRNFKIAPAKSEPNQYQIQRDGGEPAEATLSEGEITFITFLYFLQLAKGSTSKDSITRERVLVVDDPISSLDSNVLFVVSTLLKRIMNDVRADVGNIKQVVILTHNVYFHKEVSFIDGRTKEKGDTHYWILRKNDNVSSVQSFEMKNPISTSYELLWQELKDKDRTSSITIQNTMRRIIEHYFKILGRYGDEDLVQHFPHKEEQDVCRSLMSWINEGSHTIADDLFIETQTDTKEQYFRVFREVFLHTKHEGHYNMMMGVEEATVP